MMNKILQASVGVIGGIVSSFFGVFDLYVKVLLILMATDMVSGIIKGIYNKDLNSTVMYKGIIKKISMMILIGVSYQVDLVINGGPMFRNIVILFYIANEGLSILENLGNYVEYPQFLKDVLEKLKTENNEIEE